MAHTLHVSAAVGAVLREPQRNLIRTSICGSSMTSHSCLNRMLLLIAGEE
ncbi:MAG: hypothetical protein GY820_08530 [Gammaproteobacteria bacterium]|nr:hypothetical protein [Gammaproteobacteria bacterium]